MRDALFKWNAVEEKRKDKDGDEGGKEKRDENENRGERLHARGKRVNLGLFVGLHEVTDGVNAGREREIG